MTEVFKDFIYAPEHYMIGNSGSVYSKRTNKIMKTYENNKGYLCIKLDKKHYTIHKLVALHFVDGYVPELVVNHIDGKNKNNYYENLEWVTQKENIQDARNRGTLNTYTARAHLRLEKPVLQYTLDGKYVAEFSSMKEAEEHTGTPRSKISLVCGGKRKSSNGYVWKYKNPEDALTFKTLPQ